MVGMVCMVCMVWCVVVCVFERVRASLRARPCVTPVSPSRPFSLFSPTLLPLSPTPSQRESIARSVARGEVPAPSWHTFEDERDFELQVRAFQRHLEAAEEARRRA